MGRESCPHVPCVTSGGRARFARPWCGWRRGGARRGGRAPRPDTLRSRSPATSAPRPTTDAPPDRQRLAARYDPGVPQSKKGVATASTSVRPVDSHRRQTRSYTLHGSAGSSATAALGISAPHRRVAGPRSAGRPARPPRAGRRRGSGCARRPSPRAAAQATPRGRRRRSPAARPDRRSSGRSRPRAPPVPSRTGSRDSSTLPSRCASSAPARWWALTATADGAAETHRGQAVQGQVDQGRPPTGHSALGRSNVSGTQSRAAARGQHHACQTLAHGDRHAPILQPLAAPDVADLRLAAVLQRVLGAAERARAASRCRSSRSRRARDRPTGSPTRSAGATGSASPSPCSTSRCWCGPRAASRGAPHRQPHPADVRGRARRRAAPPHEPRLPAHLVPVAAPDAAPIR